MFKDLEQYSYAEEEYMENCTLRTTVDQLGRHRTYHLLPGIDVTADFTPIGKPTWSMLHEVLHRARAKVGFKPMLLGVVIFTLCSSAVLAESATSDFKRGESAESREDYDTAYELYQKLSDQADFRTPGRRRCPAVRPARAQALSGPPPQRSHP